ncbi:MAG: hypothetical protein A2Y63_04505 [Candidatus Riflebacteria bacterium RBG_13_59_9]|nr:MAG: hypothetical protein A2Y63_04505 [Candidatus Riflebacteria bacterium RBG_13_59_9]
MKRAVLLFAAVLLLASCNSDWGPGIMDNWFGFGSYEGHLCPAAGPGSASSSFLIERSIAQPEEPPDDPLAVSLRLKWSDGWYATRNPQGIPVPDELWFDPDGPAGEIPEQVVDFSEATMPGQVEVVAAYPAPGAYLASARLRRGTQWGYAELRVTVP